MRGNRKSFTPPIVKVTIASVIAAAWPMSGTAAARLEFAVGNVLARQTTGTERVLAKGAVIQPGETIITGIDGRAQLKFDDGARLSLQPETEFRIDEYVFSGEAKGQEKGFFSLIKGGLRTITGLIGRQNKQAYRMNTPAATVGIRGTEFSLLYTGGDNGSLSVGTGDGEVSVCNDAGCVFVSGGESAIVTGKQNAPIKTDVRPNLPPKQASQGSIVALLEGGAKAAPELANLPNGTFSVSDTRTDSGGIAPVGPASVSGAGFTVAVAGGKNGADFFDKITGAKTTFGSYSELLAADDGTTYFSANKIKGSFATDGVVGWGVWESGKKNSSENLANLHYVVGIPTATSSMPTSGTIDYKLAGYTLPTTTSGLVGGPVTGHMSVQFTGAWTASIVLSSTIGGAAMNINQNVSGGPDGQISFGSSPCSGTCIRGAFYGANASHAGIVYQTNVGGVGNVSGSAVFSR